ncbi:hypothetical protein [Niallia sp. NCCP-28]|nr:hypothetical protein [Niallia sp. NCCP-28]
MKKKKAFFVKTITKKQLTERKADDKLCMKTMPFKKSITMIIG